ncbi:hypothetical protein ACTXT7_000990 [Hymenolepis weldensis]
MKKEKVLENGREGKSDSTERVQPSDDSAEMIESCDLAHDQVITSSLKGTQVDMCESTNNAETSLI